MKTNYVKFSQSDLLNPIYYQSNSTKSRSNLIMYQIIKYLEVKDTISFKLSCKTISHTINDKLIKKYFKSRELTGNLRNLVWDKYLNINEYIYLIQAEE
jgi:hypothetical protein